MKAHVLVEDQRACQTLQNKAEVRILMRPHRNTASTDPEVLLRPDAQIDESEKSGGKMCCISGPQPTGIIWGTVKKNPEACFPPLRSLT